MQQQVFNEKKEKVWWKISGAHISNAAKQYKRMFVNSSDAVNNGSLFFALCLKSCFAAVELKMVQCVRTHLWFKVIQRTMIMAKSGRRKRKQKSELYAQTQKQLWVCNFGVESCFVQTCQEKINHERKIIFKFVTRKKTLPAISQRHTRTHVHNTMQEIYIIENHKPEINRCWQKKKENHPHWHAERPMKYLWSEKKSNMSKQ